VEAGTAIGDFGMGAVNTAIMKTYSSLALRVAQLLMLLLRNSKKSRARSFPFSTSFRVAGSMVFMKGYLACPTMTILSTDGFTIG
jgi:hypothetical protein